MSVIWEGPVENFLHRVQNDDNPNFSTERTLWLTDWVSSRGRGYDDFDQVVLKHTRMKKKGPWNFKPELIVTIDDEMTAPKECEHRTIKHCSGLSRSGVHGMVTAWYDSADLQAYTQITNSILPGLLLVVATPAPHAGLLNQIEEAEAEFLGKASPQLRDYLLPYYVWAKRPVPFEYHRKGCMMLFHIEAMPEGGLSRYNKKYPIFMVGSRGIGIWFDDPSLATMFRLKYTNSLNTDDPMGMRIFTNV